jgi:CpeT protein
MTGSYDSSLQAEEDSSYYNISLHMYPIWENKGGGKYLYVEQALASMQGQPYRQRVYKLQKQSDGKIASFVYTLKNDSLFVGKWKDLKYFNQFGLSILDEREGCEVMLSKLLSSYEGSTQKDYCKLTLRGVSYATSVVSIANNQITSWDQGFDEKGEQVWGATTGPYKFVKLKE